MTAILVSYQGAPVALAGPRRTDLVGELPDLPAGDPDARFALRMTYYAQLVARGELPGPYTDQDAQRFARVALIDPDQLARLADHTDDDLAEHFGIPVEQIPAARAEQPPNPEGWR